MCDVFCFSDSASWASLTLLGLDGDALREGECLRDDIYLREEDEDDLMSFFSGDFFTMEGLLLALGLASLRF